MCFHKWTKWKETQRDELHNCFGETFVRIYQEKVCEKCGKIKIRKKIK